MKLNSNALLLAVNRRYISKATTQSCVTALNNLGMTNRLTITCEPGSKINNEGVHIQSVKQLPLTITTWKRSIDAAFHNKWRHRWKNLGTCHQTRIWIHDPGKITPKIDTLTRKNLSILIQILTGHNYLNYQQFFQQLHPRGSCDICCHQLRRRSQSAIVGKVGIIVFELHGGANLDWIFNISHVSNHLRLP